MQEIGKFERARERYQGRLSQRIKPEHGGWDLATRDQLGTDPLRQHIAAENAAENKGSKKSTKPRFRLPFSGK